MKTLQCYEIELNSRYFSFLINKIFKKNYKKS